MHKTIDYDKLPEDQKEAKAMTDLKNWYGARKFKQLEKMFKEYPSMDFEQFAMAVSISGVTGYPVRVWHKKLWGQS